MAAPAGEHPGPFAWFPDWRGRACVVVGSGPSAGGLDLGQAEGRAEILCVNESWRLAPFARVLYACDGAWWRVRGGVPDFGGLRVTGDERAARTYGLQRVRIETANDRLQLRRAGVIGYGGNSGFQALNLALQFGASRIILAGFDMTLADGVHWHGAHGGGLRNPSAQSLARWARVLDAQAPLLQRLGVTVLNVSPVSALTAFPKVSLEDALAC